MKLSELKPGMIVWDASDFGRCGAEEEQCHVVVKKCGQLCTIIVTTNDDVCGEQEKEIEAGGDFPDELLLAAFLIDEARAEDLWPTLREALLGAAERDRKSAETNLKFAAKSEARARELES